MDKQADTADIRPVDARPKCGRCGQPIEGKPNRWVQALMPVGGSILVPVNVPVCAKCLSPVAQYLTAGATGPVKGPGGPMFSAWVQGEVATVIWNR